MTSRSAILALLEPSSCHKVGARGLERLEPDPIGSSWPFTAERLTHNAPPGRRGARATAAGTGTGGTPPPGAPDRPPGAERLSGGRPRVITSRGVFGG